MTLRDSLLSGEEVAFESHKHWIAPARDSLVAVLLLIAAYFVGVITPSGGGIVGAVGSLLDLIKTGLLIVGAVWIIYNIVVWRTAAFAVTNMRVIREEGLVSRRSSATLVESITDVKSRVPFLGARLGYGDLEILTQSGDAGKDVFNSITQPVAFRNEILSRKAGVRTTPPAPPEVRPPPTAAAPPAATAAPPAVPAGSTEAPAARGELAKLRDAGAITPEEYEAKKTDILSRI